MPLSAPQTPQPTVADRAADPSEVDSVAPTPARPGEVRLSPEACRRRREALGISSEELARRARLNPRTVERFEAASVRPRPVTVVALRNALRRSEAAATDSGDAPAA